MTRTVEFDIGQDFSGRTVKEFLKGKLMMSTTVMNALKRTENGLTLNGNGVFVNAVMKQGDVLRLVFTDREGLDIEPMEGNVPVLFENPDIIVVDKPPYMPVHPVKDHVRDSLANIIVRHCMRNGEDIVFRCVNRLDRNTSGLVVIAKNAYTHFLLRQQSEKGIFRKTYIALVHGNLPDFGTVNVPLKKEDSDSIRRVASADGRPAVTHFRTVERKNGLSLAEITLETGRTHQIRAHMSHIGYPLAGDFLYGDECDGVCRRQALHLAELELRLPFTGEYLKCVSDKYDFSCLMK